MARSEEFKTPLGRLSYAMGLYKTSKINNGREQYRATLIFDKKDRAFFEKYIAEVIKAEWGDKGIDMAKKGLIRNPLLAGDGKEARNKQTGDINAGLGADKIFIRVSANEDRAPWVRWKSPNTQETETNVYSGCYGKAVLSAFAWKNDQQGLGVSFGISGFQKLQEGDRLGGGSSDASAWVETVEDAGAVPETAGAGAGGLFGD